MSATLAYILKLLVLIPLVAGMAWGSLWLWRRAQQGIGGAGRRERLVTLLDATPLGATAKLAVVEFEGKRLLIAVSRTGVQLLNESGTPDKLPAHVGRFGD
ncbi:flagellar biosynthetic protein FliO [Allosphingosinicella sp.]|uniref:flagellar biosynthetic protein FliO n=1 Tax=Allosphingosinicella sp. TaxID=2823234 RepID=UPI0037846681